MTNPYFVHTPIIPKALGRSSTLNNQLSAIEDGFDLVFASVAGVNSGASTTTHTVESSGSKAFVLTSGAFAIGQFLLFADTADPANWMLGQVDAFDGDTLTVTANMIDSSGSGTKSNWTISLVPPGYESTYFTSLLAAKADIDGETHTGQTTFESCAGNGATTPAAFEFDCSANNFFRTTCTGSHTITFANVPAGSYACRIRLTNGGLGVLTLPSGSTWAGGAAPTLTAAGVDDLTAVTDDGGTTWDWASRALDLG